MEKIRLAMIGCGNIGGYHLRHIVNFTDIIEMVGFCDLIRERAEDYAKKMGQGEVFTDYREMYDKAKPDAVFICVPPYAHGQMEFDTIERGIHFFVEKPMALDLDLAREIRDRANAAKLITAVGFQCRYSSLVEPNRRFINENKVLYVSCARFGGVPNVKWWKNKEQSGGQLVEQTVHQVDLMRYMCGDPDEVFSYNASGFIQGDPDYCTDDLTTTLVKFKSGILGTIATGCYATTGEAFDSKLTFSAKDKRADLRILTNFQVYGEKVQSEENPDGLVVKGDGTMYASGGAVVYKETNPDSGIPSDRTFLESVVSGDGSKIRTPYSDAFKTLSFVLSCNESMKTGKAVKVAEK